jgi:hypothetical protein
VNGDVNLAIGGATTEGGIIPSVEVQIGAFHAAGGQFGTNARVAADAAAAQSRNIEALIGAGARTIVVASLPDLGATPRFNGNAATAEAGLTATNTSTAYWTRTYRRLPRLIRRPTSRRPISRACSRS